MTRRDPKSGSVFKLGADKFRVQVTVGYTATGKRRYKRRLVNGDRAQADQVLLDMLVTYGGATVDDGRLTLAKVAQRWLDTVNPSRDVATQYVAEKDITRNIINHPIGRLLIDKVDVEPVAAWQRSFAGQSHWTIRDHRKHLSAILTWAEGQKMRRGDPLKFVPPPRKTKSTKRAFTDPEAERFVAACQEEDELYGPLFIVMLSMGHRPGETTGLSWPAIDWAAGTIKTDEALKRIAGRPVHVGTTKTDKPRTLRVTSVVIEALRVEQMRQEVARLSAGAGWPRQWDGLVFLGTDERYPRSLGRPPNTKTIGKQLARICAAAGVPSLTPYELRHTAGDILLRRDVSPSKVADAMGTSERMLREHYHHVDPVIDIL